MVFQNYALYPHMTVADNIGYALKVAGMPKAERAEKVAQVASSVGLDEFLDRRPGALSGGQRQRVAMARAIIREPDVFLFDEPLSNLDAKLRVQMRHEIRRIHNRVKATSVFVTHDQHEGMTLADRMVIMNQGTIDQVGTPEEVYNTPATTYVAGFIGSPAMNFFGGQVSAAQSAVVLDDGTALPLPGSVTKAMDGKIVQIGARPEALGLCQPGSGALTAKFEFYEELGSEGLHHLKVEDVPLSVLSETKMRLEEGAEIGVSIPQDALHVFDAESGRRIPLSESEKVEETA
jgi:sn-glycerol 3-phosphate transport system ATP-binding protein